MIEMLGLACLVVLTCYLLVLGLRVIIEGLSR